MPHLTSFRLTPRPPKQSSTILTHYLIHLAFCFFHIHFHLNLFLVQNYIEHKFAIKQW